MLDAREQDVLSPQPPLTLQDLEGYAESTASQLLYLQLAAAGVCCGWHSMGTGLSRV
jgi:NADH dehydrogenase [ubiquinone] 1 alpha subcomplex assembly factor 6